MPTDQASLVPLYSALIGGALSLGGSALGIWLSKHLERKYEAKQLAKAFKGEISALVHIAEVRGYSNGLRRVARLCEEENELRIYSVAVREEYRAIYKANAGKIGLLPGTLPERIAILYTQVASILEDLKTLHEIQIGTRDKFILGGLKEAVRKYLEMADLMDDTIDKAKGAVRIIDDEYPISTS